MATVIQPDPTKLTVADFKGRVDPDWCPGCGDFGVLSSLQKVLVELQIVEEPVNPITLALAAGATFVARAFSAEPKHLTDLMKQGLQHKGFAFIDVFSPCVTYNHDNTYPWFKERVKKLEDDPNYDPSDWHEAMKRALLWGDEIPIGKFFERKDLPSLDQSEPVLDEGGPLAHRQLRIPPEVAREFVTELM